MTTAGTNTMRHTTLVGLGVLALLHVSFLLLVQTGMKELYVLMIGAVPLVVILMLQFEFLFLALPAFLFLNIHFYGFSSSEFIAALVSVAFLLTHERYSRDDLGSAPVTAILSYAAVLLVSLTQSVDPGMSLLLTTHFLLFITVLAVTGATVRTISVLERVVNIFIVMVTINALHVLVLAAVTGSRVFGFAGIMFVDYVGIAVVIAFLRTLFSVNDRQRIIAVSLLLLFTVALILTQTRTSWISTAIVIGVLMVIIGRMEESVGLMQGIVRRYLVKGVMVLTVVLALAMLFNPSTFDRLADVNSGSEELISETGVVKNSLVSRLLIWHTAYNGFIAHPLLGVGAYSFPLTSMYLYTIPEELYALYVETLTPHQTYIAVAVETGIIGLLAFGVMIVALLRYIWRVVDRNRNHPDRLVVFSCGGSVLYIVVSTLTTDAWLWGHGVVLFALMTGCVIAFERLTGGAR